MLQLGILIARFFYVDLNVNKGDVLFFFGEIGVGKTTFIRYLINNIQKKNRLKLTEVTSPTFNLLNEYKVKDFLIEHYDLFRLKNINDTSTFNEDILSEIYKYPEKKVIIVNTTYLLKITY